MSEKVIEESFDTQFDKTGAIVKCELRVKGKLVKVIE